MDPCSVLLVLQVTAQTIPQAQPNRVLSPVLLAVAGASAPSCCKGASWGCGNFPVSPLSPRGLGPILIFLFSFLFHPTWLCGDLSCHCGCIGDLLPAFNWYSVRIVPHVRCIFGMFVAGEASSTFFYSAILISPPSFLFPKLIHIFILRFNRHRAFH